MIRAAVLATCIFATAPAFAQASNGRAEGRCQYPDKAKDYVAETTFIACDGVAVDRQGEGVEISFTRRGWGQSDRFYGRVEGHDIRISRVSLRAGETRDAEGTCRVTAGPDGRPSVASCLVKSRARWIAANFVASRF